jgi:LacI family transcriptional regulator
MAGELLTRFLPGRGQVAFFTGWLTTYEHAVKLRGLQAGLRSAGGALKLASVVEAHDDEREAYRQTMAILRSNRDLKALYVSTVNSLPVLRAAEQERRLAGLTVVTTDLFPELVPWIRAGKVVATVYQRPITQGRIALQALAQFLLKDIRPAQRLRVAPHLVMRSNLELFLEKLGVECQPQVTRAAERPGSRRTPASRPSQHARVPPRRRARGPTHRT